MDYTCHRNHSNYPIISPRGNLIRNYIREAKPIMSYGVIAYAVVEMAATCLLLSHPSNA
jgi:hypothetical protein